MIKTENFLKVEIKSILELRDWLSNNFSQDDAVWLVTFKKSEKDKYVSRNEVLDELICFGWIDGIRRKVDDKKTMQLISPRRVQHWAKSYKDRAKRLIKESKMHQSGLDSIKQGKESGLWNFMDNVEKLIIPKDLKLSLEKHKGDYEFFVHINDSSKRFVLRWIKLAKTERTRTNRINKICKLSLKGEKLPGS